jgi:hypothetical protein
MNANPILPLPALARSSGLERSAASPPERPPEGPSAESGPSPGPNPALRVDPKLGIVVLEFLDAQGKTISSLPTERVLAEYRRTGHPAGTELTEPSVEAPNAADTSPPASA